MISSSNNNLKAKNDGFCFYPEVGQKRYVFFASDLNTEGTPKIKKVQRARLGMASITLLFTF